MLKLLSLQNHTQSTTDDTDDEDEDDSSKTTGGQDDEESDNEEDTHGIMSQLMISDESDVEEPRIADEPKVKKTSINLRR